MFPLIPLLIKEAILVVRLLWLELVNLLFPLIPLLIKEAISGYQASCKDCSKDCFH